MSPPPARASRSPQRVLRLTVTARCEVPAAAPVAGRNVTRTVTRIRFRRRIAARDLRDGLSRSVVVPAPRATPPE